MLMIAICILLAFKIKVDVLKNLENMIGRNNRNLLLLSEWGKHNLVTINAVVKPKLLRSPISYNKL